MLGAARREGTGQAFLTGWAEGAQQCSACGERASTHCNRMDGVAGAQTQSTHSGLLTTFFRHRLASSALEVGVAAWRSPCKAGAGRRGLVAAWRFEIGRRWCKGWGQQRSQRASGAHPEEEARLQHNGRGPGAGLHGWWGATRAGR